MISLLAGTVLLLASGCDRPAVPDTGALGEGTLIEGEEALPDLAPTPGEGRDRPFEPAAIYYDLTAFDWYRRGEPLLLEGRRYLPGKVEPTGDREFAWGGAYDGVDYYLPQGSEGSGAELSDTVYVPVYRGYWLPFASEGGPPPVELAN